MAQYSVDIVAKALGGSEVDRLANSFKNVETAAAKAQQGMGGAANNIRDFGKGVATTTTSVNYLGMAFQSVLGPLASVAAALALVKKGLDTAFERGAAEQKLKNFTDSTEEYNAALAVASQAAQRFGLSQTEASTALADVYGRLKGLGFGLKETSEIYMGFNAIAKASGTTAEDASGAFLQLSQALGSGKLQGDELRAILERMPQLAQAIASSMGVSAAEIRKMGEEGKITSDVIYKALSGAATASGDFSNKLNDQQKAMASLKQVADQLLNSIGQVFAPFVIAGAEALAAVGQKLADWWGYLGNVIFPQVMAAVEPLRSALANAFADIDFSVIIDVVQNVLIAQMKVAIAGIRDLASALAVVVNWFKELSNNAIIQGLVGAMGAIVEKLGLAGSKVKDWKAEQEKVTEEAAASLDNYTSMPKPIEDAKDAAKKLKEAQEQVTQEMTKTAQAADQLAQVQTTAVDQALSLSQARLQAEMAVNEVLLQQANAQLAAANTQAERISAAQSIYDLTVRQADLELQSSLAAIDAEVQKARIMDQVAYAKYKELQAVVKIAEAQGTVTRAHYEALAAQRASGIQLEKAYQTTAAIAVQQRTVANAVYQGKVEAAGLAYQANAVDKSMSGAANNAVLFRNNLQGAAGVAKEIANTLGSLGGGGAGGGFGGVQIDFGAAGKNRAFMEAYMDEINRFNKDQQTHWSGVTISMAKITQINEKYLAIAEEFNRKAASAARQEAQNAWIKNGGSQLPRFASGGYVTSPQVAMVGEGGEPEYIIPKSRMDNALANYAAGKRGDAVLSAPSQINLTYSGNIIRQDQGDYLSTSAVPGIVRQAVDQTISTLGRNPGARRSAGIA